MEIVRFGLERSGAKEGGVESALEEEDLESEERALSGRKRRVTIGRGVRVLRSTLGGRMKAYVWRKNIARRKAAAQYMHVS